MLSILNSRLFFWLLLALPGAAMTYEYGLGLVDAMEMLHPTGETSVRLLIAALAITPLLALTKGAPKLQAIVRWLQARRRYIGVAAFAYAAAHLAFYVVDMGTLAAVLGEALLLGIWTGWAAFFLLLPLALTSNQASMRALRSGWKRLQRLAYPAAVLTLVHWIVVHDGFIAALAHALPLVFLEAYRLFKLIRRVPQNA